MMRGALPLAHDVPCTRYDSAIIAVDIAAAKARAIATAVTETEVLPLSRSIGRVLAEDLDASLNLPNFDNSAMDGYAVRLCDFVGKGPWRFDVVGRRAAGDGLQEDASHPNAALRIMTGALVPDGFDAVVMQEHCRRDAASIIIDRRPAWYDNIRRVGEDVRVGARLLPKGTLLNAQKLALLAGQGVAELSVIRKVRIGLISTGSELRNPGEALEAGQIYNSNRVLISSMLAPLFWAEVVDFGIVPDRLEVLAQTVGRAVKSCDVIVTTGGVSAGEEDHVLSALAQNGARLDVLKVAMRPGKPVKIGLIGTKLIACLPGNPNAALVTFHQIALPAIRIIAGLSEYDHDWVSAVANFSYQKQLGRTEFVPARVVGRDLNGSLQLEMLGRGSSANMMTMAHADGIAVLAPQLSEIDEGTALRFYKFCDC